MSGRHNIGSDRCPVCHSTEGLHVCGGCHQVAYCSKEHQKSDWKVHKSHCSPMTLSVCEKIGRHYVAARKLKPGEIVLTEEPILKVPSFDSNQQVCLGCYGPIPSQGINIISKEISKLDQASILSKNGKKSKLESDEFGCQICGWPLCSRACQKSSEHVLECSFLTQHCKPHDKNSNKKMYDLQTESVQIHQCQKHFGKVVAVIRVLALMVSKDSQNQAIFDQLMDMEAHMEEPRSKDFVECLEWIVGFISSILDMNSVLKACCSKILQKTGIQKDPITFYPTLFKRIVSIFEVNAFQLPDSNVLAAFPKCAIMEHSCLPNIAKTFDSNGALHMRVLRPVEKGEHLSHCYTEPLWGLLARRHHMRTTKFFDCSCPRCEDPSEFGTHFNAIKCPICLLGYVEPHFLKIASRETSPDEPSRAGTVFWKCRKPSCMSNTGKAQQDFQLLEDVCATVTRELGSIEKTDIEGFEDFLRRFGKALHPNHHCVIEASRVLSQLYGNLPSTVGKVSQGHVMDEAGRTLVMAEPSCRMSIKELKRKEEHCRKVLKVIDVIQPGATRLKGGTLFELQSTMTQKAMSEEVTARRLGCLQEARTVVLDCIEIMDVNIPGSIESQLAEAAKAELRTIELHIIHGRRITGVTD